MAEKCGPPSVAVGAASLPAVPGGVSQAQVKIANYILGDTLGAGTFGKVKGNIFMKL